MIDNVTQKILMDHLPYELVEEVLQWLPTERLYLLKTLCKKAYKCYYQRIRSVQTLRIVNIKDEDGYSLELLGSDFHITRKLLFREECLHEDNTRILQLFTRIIPSSIISVVIDVYHMGVIYSLLLKRVLMRTPNIVELYCPNGLSYEMIAPLKQLKCIQFNECSSTVTLEDCEKHGIYWYLPGCCVSGPITFINNKGANTEVCTRIDTWLKEKRYGYKFEYEGRDGWKLWNKLYSSTRETKRYTYQRIIEAHNRFHQGFIENIDDVLFFYKLPSNKSSIQKKKRSHKTLVYSNVRYWRRNLHITEIDSSVNNIEISPPGVLPRIWPSRDAYDPL